MDVVAVALDDSAILVRWLHVVAAIAWVGSAFALLKLDLAMKPRAADSTPQTLFLNAGAGFRLLRATDADRAERALNFKVEAYATWASGFALLCLVFCAAPQLHLIDPQVWNAAPWLAIVAALVPLALSWLAYDALCKRSGLNGDTLLWAVFGFAAVLAFALTHVFAGRAAYVLIGAHFGTLMVANIAHVVAPAQKQRLASLRAGLPADDADAKAAAVRALHNQYLALPTVFFMLSGHAPLLFAGPDNGLAAISFIAGFFLIRRIWLQVSRGLGMDRRLAVAASACLLLGLALSAPRHPKADAEARNASEAIALAVRPGAGEAQKIVDGHCVACHSPNPQVAGLAGAAGGLNFTTPESVAKHRDAILRAAVYSRAMPPPGAAPALDADEKTMLLRWAASGK
jgi:uncharacterized membrane protein